MDYNDDGMKIPVQPNGPEGRSEGDTQVQVTPLTFPIRYGETSYVASLVETPAGALIQSLVINQEIYKEARSLFKSAVIQALDAEATHTLYRDCGQLTYEGETGRNAQKRALQAHRRVNVLASIVATPIGECCGDKVQVKEWRDLLLYFARPLSIGSIGGLQ
jgi:hypothetical protein